MCDLFDISEEPGDSDAEEVFIANVAVPLTAHLPGPSNADAISQTSATEQFSSVVISDINSPTSMDPNKVKMTGPYGFSVEFNVDSKRKTLDFSRALNKLYVDINYWVEVYFKLAKVPGEDLYVRALPVFSEAVDFKNPVVRCPNHSRLEDTTNVNFEFINHFIRFDNLSSMYCEDTGSGRLSVVLPLLQFEQEQPSSSSRSTFFSSCLIKFMCLGSDVGGPNRRPMQVIFTLEDKHCSVLGRDLVNLKVCCCPRRDKASEEKRLMHHTKVEESQKSFGPTSEKTEDITLSTPSSTNTSSDIMSNKNIALVPVHKEDFKKINEFAEAAWICRDLSNADKIKEMRRTLLREHNQELIKSIEEKRRETNT